MSYTIRDWSNRPAGRGAYTPEQIELLQGADWILWNANAALTTEALDCIAAYGLDQSRIIPRVGMLHTRSDYDTTDWPWFQAEGELLNGTALLNAEEQPVARWSGGGQSDVYNTDPHRVDPQVWARLVVSQLHSFGYEWVFLDYFSTKPWDFHAGRSLDVSADFDLAWQYWQRLARMEIGSSRVGVCANGRLALDMPELVKQDMTYIERGGTLWYPPSVMAERIRLNGGTHYGLALWDETPGPRHHNQPFGYAMGLADGMPLYLTRVVTLEES